MDEPRLRAWIQHPAAPAPYYETRAGHWVTAPGWAGSAAATKTLFPGDGGLAEEPGGPVSLSTPENTGHAAGNWCGYSVVPDGPVDQGGEAGMVCFDTAPLDSDLELLGFPILSAEVASDVPQANLVAVLSEVDGEGRATRISYGVLNLTHRNSHAKPEPLPGEPVPVRLQLNACGQRVGKGHRLRLALSNAYWPIIWPSQSRASLTLTDARIDLPVCTGDPAPDCFEDPEGAAPLETEVLSEGNYGRSRSIDLITGTETCELVNDSGLECHLHTGIETRAVSRKRFSIHPEDPNSAVGTCAWTKQYARGDWRADVGVSVTVRALKDAWQIDATLKAVDGDGVVAEKTWSEKIPRDLV